MRESQPQAYSEHTSRTWRTSMTKPALADQVPLRTPPVMGQTAQQPLRQAQQDVGVLVKDPLFPQEPADEASPVEIESILSYSLLEIRPWHPPSLP